MNRRFSCSIQAKLLVAENFLTIKIQMVAQNLPQEVKPGFAFINLILIIITYVIFQGKKNQFFPDEYI